MALNARVNSAVAYTIRMEPGVQTPAGNAGHRSGFVPRFKLAAGAGAAATLGLAARFVSGYLIQLAPDVKSLDSPSGTEVDFTDLHAWVEVYIPRRGLDRAGPDLGPLTGESHIRWRDAALPQCAPISGGSSAGAPRSSFDFDMQVRRVAEHPRITKTLQRRGMGRTERAWPQGRSVNLPRRRRAADHGRRADLCPIDDFEAAEWNNDAVGLMKRDLADKLIRRLRDRFAPGGFLHYRQGKYGIRAKACRAGPFSLYWRRDGQPVWKTLIWSRARRRITPTPIRLHDFMATFAERLGIARTTPARL